MPMVAWYMLSKESYMKRVIREVLPTKGVWGQLSGTCSLKTFVIGAYRSVHPGRPV